MSNENIIVQIASYRDPELLATLRDAIKKADKPENLRFSIAWQHSKDDEWDTLEEFVDDTRFKIIDIASSDSKGACWARSLTQQMYTDETYTMQIDSHHRFTRGWDTKCKTMLADLKKEGYEKPLLTAYLPSYDPTNDPQARVKEVWKLDFDRFTPEGVIFMLPSTLEDWQSNDLPTPTRFFSAHFVFTYGSWNTEVPYDPNLYFHGEEISLAVRSYTCGYDLFIPNKIVAWHEYTRNGRTKHWDDSKVWEETNRNSLKRVKYLLGVDGDKDETLDFGVYGLGTLRSKEDYEQYAGIRFEDRSVQKYTLDNYEAPNPLYRTKKSYEQSFVHRFKHCIDVYKQSVGDEDWDAWAVIFEDEDGTVLYRKDADRDEIRNIKETSKNGDFYNVWRSYDESKKVPHKSIVWPYSYNNTWGQKIESVLTKL